MPIQISYKIRFTMITGITILLDERKFIIPEDTMIRSAWFLMIFLSQSATDFHEMLQTLCFKPTSKITTALKISQIFKKTILHAM